MEVPITEEDALTVLTYDFSINSQCTCRRFDSIRLGLNNPMKARITPQLLLGVRLLKRLLATVD